LNLPNLPVSTGFATVHGNNTLTINAVDAYPLESFSVESVRAGLAEANKVLGSSAPEAEKAEAKIEVEVFEALQAALAK
jgi:F-type H+-transporting ATPase subunit delta